MVFSDGGDACVVVERANMRQVKGCELGQVVGGDDEVASIASIDLSVERLPPATIERW